MATRNYDYLEPNKPDEPDQPQSQGRGGRRWKKVAAWVAGSLLALFLLAALGLAVLLYSRRFHDYVIATVQQQASQKLNTRVTLQNYVLRLSNLSLDLYGVTVYGVGPGANVPLLQADHLGARLKVTSFLKRTWYVENVAVNHPVVKLLVNAAGETNLPKPQPSKSSSNTDVFDLGVRHALLDRGEIYYNDRKSAFDADLRDFTFRSSYDTTEKGRYFGSLSYRDGHLRYGTYAPIPHDLDAQFDARRSGLKLQNVVLRSGKSQVVVNAALTGYNHPKVHASYAVSLATAEFRNVLKNPSVPAGVITTNGIADYASVSNRPLLTTLTVEGDLRSRRLNIEMPSLRTAIEDLGAHYKLAGGDADVRDLRARVLGGLVTGAASVRDLSGKSLGHAEAKLQGVSLAELKALANAQGLKQVAITGRLDGTTGANWSGNAQDLTAKADLASNASVASAARQPEATTLPLNAAIHADYNGRRQELAVSQSYIRTPQTSVDLNGTVSTRSVLQVQVRANDLHELETLANLFSTAKPGQPAQPLGLYGSASFNGTVRGTTTAPQLAGHLDARNLRVRGSELRSLRTDIAANPSLAKLTNGDIQPAQRGRVRFDLQVALHGWSYTPSNPMVVNLNVSQLSVAELVHAANASIPASGTLNANVALHGTQLNPIGQGSIDLTDAQIQGEPIQSASIRFDAAGDVAHANLNVRIPAGVAQGQVTYYPKNQGYEAALQATNIQLAKIATLQRRRMGITGTLNLQASGRGTVKNPGLQASLTIPRLTVQKQQIDNINLQAGVANQEATFNLNSSVLNTPLLAKGKIGLTGDYDTDATLDTPVIPLQPLVATYAPAQAAAMSGETEVHAKVHGPLKDKNRLDAHVTISRLNVEYRAAANRSIQIGAVAPIQADFTSGVLTVQPGAIKGTGTDLRFQGKVPLNSNAPSSITLLGSVDLGLAQIFSPDLSSGGRLQFDINAAGANPAEDVKGQIRVVNASFSTPDAPLGLSNGNGVLTLRNERLDVTHFTGKVGGGEVQLSGGVVYRPALQFDLGLSGKGLRLLYPESVRTDLDLNLALAGTTEASLVRGQVNINRVSFTPDFDLTSFTSQFGGPATPPATGGFTENMKLNVAVHTTSELNIVSSQLSVQGSANLRVIGTASNPVIVGRTNLSGGDLIFMGNRYVLQGGTIDFVNSIETEPVVNLNVSTTIQQYNIAMRFQGPIDQLHTNYSSDPSLPPADIINLLAFGKTTEASGAQATPGNLGAESVLASGVSSQATSRLQKAAGISQLSVDPVLGGSGRNPGARITIQQRVTSKIFVTFSSDVTSTENQLIQLEYHMNRHWSVSGLRDQNGGFGFDGRYRKDF